MVFKRFKSILKMESMPKKTSESCETWLNCKMLIALLIEKCCYQLIFFYVSTARSLSREMKILYFLILGCFSNCMTLI